MIKKIRPRLIFALAEKKLKFSQRNLLIDLPPSYIGSLTLLETSVLVTFAKCIRAKKIFEFGTYFGGTTKNLANNTDPSTKIYSLDIDIKKMRIDNSRLNLKTKNYLKNEKINDNYLMDLQKKKGAFKINELKNFNKKKIKLLKLNSLDFEGKNYKEQFDIIFIDGGHDSKTILSDTKNSNIMAAKNSIIFWHDYNSKIHTSVTKNIDKYAKNKTIYHIENTMIVFQLNGKFKKLFNDKSR
jgi:predicted O-methyltransferase YrrM